MQAHQHRPRGRSVAIVLAVIALISVGLESFAAGETLVTGFEQTELLRGVANPTAINVAPDGRIFVSQQDGRLRVVKNGVLQPTPFLTITVGQTTTAGLMGIAFDPQFPAQPYIYAFYTAATPTRHSRVSRFTANGDVAVPGSEVPLIDLPTLANVQINHDGGDLAFGIDGKLYITVGDNVYSLNGQNLGTTFGKLLRINKDGTIPTDNPFYGTTTGINRAIWAYGLRNPFKMAVQPGTGRMFVDDVGNASWEEINQISKGGNFGWALSEGPTSDPQFTAPFFTYSHTTGSPTGCSVTGGAFYNPTTQLLPNQYVGDYFFSDYCSNWIGTLDLAGPTPVYTKLANIPTPVDMDVASDGSILVLSQANGGTIFRIGYRTTATAPTITQQPVEQSVNVGQSATFTCAASGTPTPTYRWQRDSVDISGATGPSYTLTNAQITDSGKRFRCVATNASGSATSDSVLLNVSVPSQPPTATITSPSIGLEYSGAQVVTYTGTGTDPEDGTLPASAFEWEVVFHHDQHTHPFILPFTGVKSGTFSIPTIGETDTNQWYRIRLTVHDAGGQTNTVQRDIYPRVSTVQVQTVPPGLQILLDGQPVTTPVTTTGVVNTERGLGAPTPQYSGGSYYAFDSWSQGGARDQTVIVPSTTATYTATFTPQASIPRVTDGLVGFWNFNEGTGTVVHDTSGNGTPLDLTIADPAKTQWTPDGLTLLQSTRVQTSGAATKLITAAKATNAFTLETWTTAANTTQGSPARIAAIAKDPWSRNVELGPDATRFLGRVRTSLAASTDLPTPTGTRHHRPHPPRARPPDRRRHPPLRQRRPTSHRHHLGHPRQLGRHHAPRLRQRPHRQRPPLPRPTPPHRLLQQSPHPRRDHPEPRRRLQRRTRTPRSEHRDPAGGDHGARRWDGVVRRGWNGDRPAPVRLAPRWRRDPR